MHQHFQCTTPLNLSVILFEMVLFAVCQGGLGGAGPADGVPAGGAAGAGPRQGRPHQVQLASKIFGKHFANLNVVSIALWTPSWGVQ